MTPCVPQVQAQNNVPQDISMDHAINKSQNYFDVSKSNHEVKSFIFWHNIHLLFLIEMDYVLNSMLAKCDWIKNLFELDIQLFLLKPSWVPGEYFGEEGWGRSGMILI